MEKRKKVIFRIDSGATGLPGNNRMGGAIIREFSLDNYDSVVDECYVLFMAWFGLMQSTGIDSGIIIDIVDSCLNQLEDDLLDVPGEDDEYFDDEEEEEDTSSFTQEDDVDEAEVREGLNIPYRRNRKPTTPVEVVENKRIKNNIIKDKKNFEEFTRMIAEKEDFRKNVFNIFVEYMMGEE